MLEKFYLITSDFRKMIIFTYHMEVTCLCVNAYICHWNQNRIIDTNKRWFGDWNSGPRSRIRDFIGSGSFLMCQIMQTYISQLPTSMISFRLATLGSSCASFGGLQWRNRYVVHTCWSLNWWLIFLAWCYRPRTKILACPLNSPQIFTFWARHLVPKEMIEASPARYIYHQHQKQQKKADMGFSPFSWVLLVFVLHYYYTHFHYQSCNSRLKHQTWAEQPYRNAWMAPTIV